MATRIITARDETPPLLFAINALIQLFSVAVKYREIWAFLSVQDIKSRFRRSYLGVFWMIGHQLAFSFGGGLLWAVIFRQDPSDFIPFIAAGFAIWGIISASFVDSCNAYVIAQGFAKQVDLPLQIYIWRHMSNAFFNASFGLVTALLVVLAMKNINSFGGLLYLIPGIVLVAISLTFVAGTMAFLGGMYRDLPHALSGLFQMLFVVSPIIYPPEMLVARGFGYLIYLNPLSAIIQVLREPIIHQRAAAPIDYAIVVAIGVAFAVSYVVLDRRVGRRVVYYI